ncbi:hypothetical protein MRB53_023500 [Persea americana]|uniref:Uncharacterized protein n=1 Tax=Persea americana TaxID=3435 RepID=A0ACC2L9K1_PERAE|nr:hypothetical protein MRB53_023500 [Persea americana]
MRITASSFTDPPRISRTNCPKNEARFETALKPLQYVFGRKRDRHTRDWFLSPNLPETHSKVKCHHSAFRCTSFNREVRRMRSPTNTFPEPHRVSIKLFRFGNGSEPHGISSQARISQSPVLNENRFSELQRELLSSAEFVKRPSEPVFSYTHLEHGFIVKWIRNCPNHEFQT